jgi:hypothetical protein
MRAFLLLLFLLAAPAAAQTPPDFVLSESYLHSLAQRNSAIVDQPVVLTKHTAKVHPLASDCEMHLAGSPIGDPLGDPPAVVVEPPNLCEFKLAGDPDWGDEFDTHVIGRNCVASGYPRIFTEHAAGGTEEGPNPNHVLEVHPALRIACGGDVIDFTSYLKYFPKMRAIKPSSADDCVRNRTLSMRYNPAEHRYEFLQDGGHGCGNFAIAEIAFLEPKWIQTIHGGHSAIARVSLDGQDRVTLKLYTLAGTEADQWLTAAKTNGLGSERVYVHGMLTYDYFGFVKAMRSKAGHWVNPTAWTKVDHPLALVLFGRTAEPPWSGED